MNSFAHRRQHILQEMAQIQSMELGAIQAEKRPSKNNPEQTIGPYFKHQVWENGGHRTRRIPVEKVDPLAQAIDSRKRFEQLAQEFIDTTVAMTRAPRSPLAGSKKSATSSRQPSKRKAPG